MLGMFWWIVLVFFIIAAILCILKKLHFDHKDCTLPHRLDGRLVFVTGCNTGIGFELVAELARRGARVVLACRTMDKSICAKERLLHRFGTSQKSGIAVHKGDPHLISTETQLNFTPIRPDQLICIELDLESTQSIRSCASGLMKREPVLDILINNAAVSLGQFEYSPDNIEYHMKVNHLGHFLLTELLCPLLTASGNGRVINVSSLMHRFAELDPMNLRKPVVGSAYAASKLANVMHARELHQRHSQIVSVSVHPGLVRTDIFRSTPVTRWVIHHLFRWFTKSSRQGAQTVLFCALEPNLEPGAFYTECKPRVMNSQALDPQICERVWQSSIEMIQQWEAGPCA